MMGIDRNADATFLRNNNVYKHFFGKDVFLRNCCCGNGSATRRRRRREREEVRQRCHLQNIAAQGSFSVIPMHEVESTQI